MLRRRRLHLPSKRPHDCCSPAANSNGGLNTRGAGTQSTSVAVNMCTADRFQCMFKCLCCRELDSIRVHGDVRDDEKTKQNKIRTGFAPVSNLIKPTFYEAWIELMWIARPLINLCVKQKNLRSDYTMIYNRPCLFSPLCFIKTHLCNGQIFVKELSPRPLMVVYLQLLARPVSSVHDLPKMLLKWQRAGKQPSAPLAPNRLQSLQESFKDFQMDSVVQQFFTAV